MSDNTEYTKLEQIAISKYGTDPEGGIKFNLIKRIAFVEGAEYLYDLIKTKEDLHRKELIKAEKVGSMQIKFNDSESAHERGQTKPLILEDELIAVKMLNESLELFRLSRHERDCIQRFFNNYQNMHHLCTINGLFNE